MSVLDKVYRRKVRNLASRMETTESQMADNTLQLKDFTGSGQSQAYVSFVDDDSYDDFLQKMKPILDTKGVKCSIAAVSNFVGQPGMMTLSDLQTLQSQGFEICSHGQAHLQLSTLNETGADTECKTSYDWFNSNGLTVKSFVYPSGSEAIDYVSHNIVKRYYRSGISVHGNNNILPVEQYCLKRYTFINYDLTGVEGIIDSAIVNNEWVVFLTHSWESAFDATAQANLGSLIDYIQSKNVPILTVNEVLDEIENVVDVTDQNGNYVRVSKSGQFKTNIPNGVNFAGSIVDATPSITAYPKNVMTVSIVQPNSTGAPTTLAGIMLTYRPDYSLDAYSYQTFFATTNPAMFKRRWSSTSQEWDVWGSVGTYFNGIRSNIDNAPSYFYQNNITIDNIASTAINNPLKDVNGNPAAGIMVTFRPIDTNELYTTQLAINHSTGTILKRKSNGTTGWTAWQKISGTLALTTTVRNGGSIIFSTGDCVFDTTLNKPIWRNSANDGWVDATGTTV